MTLHELNMWALINKHTSTEQHTAHLRLVVYIEKFIVWSVMARTDV